MKELELNQKIDESGIYIVDHLDSISKGNTDSIKLLARQSSKLSNWNFIEFCSTPAFEICIEELRSDDEELRLSVVSLMGMYFYYLDYEGSCRDCDMRLAKELAYLCNDDYYDVRRKAYWALSNFVAISQFGNELVSEYSNILLLAITHEQENDTDEYEEISKEARWFLCNLLSTGGFPVIGEALKYGLNINELEQRVESLHDDLNIMESIYQIKAILIKHNPPI